MAVRAFVYYFAWGGGVLLRVWLVVGVSRRLESRHLSIISSRLCVYMRSGGHLGESVAENLLL